MTERTPEDILLEITGLCAELGWVVGMNENSNGSIRGIIIGTGDYVSDTINKLEDGEEYDLYEHGSKGEGELH